MPLQGVREVFVVPAAVAGSTWGHYRPSGCSRGPWSRWRHDLGAGLGPEHDLGRQGFGARILAQDEAAPATPAATGNHQAQSGKDIANGEAGRAAVGRAGQEIALRVVEPLGDHVAHDLLESLLQGFLGAALDRAQSGGLSP